MFTQCDRAHDIGTADDANNFISPHYREPFDLVRCHELGDLLDRSLFGDADDLLAHDRLDVFTLLRDDIGLGDDTHDLAVLAGHRSTADLILDQGHRQIFHRHRWIHGDDISGHYIFGNHLQFPPRPTLKTVSAGCSKRSQRRGARKIDERRRTQPVRWSEAIERNEAYESFSAAC